MYLIAAVIVEQMNILFKEVAQQAKGSFHGWNQWEVYKGTGDGAIFIFGNLLDPKSICDTLYFAAWTMKAVLEHNQKLPPKALNIISVRMAVSYGSIYLTQDLEGGKDIVGNAINKANRLVSVKEAFGNCIFLTSEIYHSLQLNKRMFYVNEDESIPESGELSDSVIGKKPDSNNFLYIVRKGLFESKDRVVEAFNIAGRLGGIDFHS